MNGLLALAFGAGILAPVNPCGFAVLPAFLAYSIDADSGRDDPRTGVAVRLAGGLRAGLALTAGFAGTLTTVGLLLAVGMRSLISAVPWLALAFGTILVMLGLAMLLGAHLPVRLPGRPAGIRGHGQLSMIAFGAGYALASAACSVALLLAVVTQALATTNLSGVLVVFAAYAAGSATLLLTFALFAAFASTAITRYLRPLLAHMHLTVRLAEGGMDIKTTQQILGHSSPITTLQVYSHVSENSARSAMHLASASIGI